MRQTQVLDGPRLPARGGTIRQLVVFLHGYGADGHDLIDIGRRWASALPDAAFVSPHAPEPCGGAPYGRQWFALADMSPRSLASGVAGAAASVDRFLDSELARHGLSARSAALVGFSQGAMMALHAGPRRSQALAGVVSYSGILADPQSLAQQIASRPPFLLTHGGQDQIIPAAALDHAVKGLAAAGLAAEWHLRPTMGHGIDETCLDLGADFLARLFR